VLLHPLSGVLSAYGIGRAEQRQLREAVIRAPLQPALVPMLRQRIAALRQEAVAALERSGDLRPGEQHHLVVRLELRFPGSERGLELLWPEAAEPMSERSEDTGPRDTGPRDIAARDIAARDTAQRDPAEREVAQRPMEIDGDGRSSGASRVDSSDGSHDGRLVRALLQDFATSHRRRFGYLPSDPELVVERLLLELAAGKDQEPRHDPSLTIPVSDSPQAEAVDPTATTDPATATDPELAVPDSTMPPAGLATATAPAHTRVWLAGVGWRWLPLWHRAELPAGTRLQGPAVVIDATTTLMLEPHWQASLLNNGELLLERQAPPSAEAGTVVCDATPLHCGSGDIDPVELELFHHRFAAIAEQMGVQLQLSSRSVNIRERLDFSCALFDGKGALVANAPHIPVHLGSMGESVASLLADVAARRRPPLAPGDVILSNDPYAGGTHLPDITAITPVFAAGAPAGEAPLFFVASRGHHADVGGITPGSMPAFSTTIDQEGLLLRNEAFLSGGLFDEAAWRHRLAAGRHPVRNPDQLLADLQAQVAANRQGVAALEQLIASEGQDMVQAFMGHVQANAAAAVRRVIDRLQPGSHAVELDGGAWIQVSVTPDRQRRRVQVDFSGTTPQLSSNHNAPLAVTHAVVLYVFRCLVGEEIPLNAGCFEPIDLVVPSGCLLNPSPPAAVVAGNVETSQAACNALFGALGVLAASQGTMNNLSFGDEAQGPASRQYYETICGGSGAGVLADGHGFAGAAAVQSHMTNSRLTDPEILEERFPVRLERFAIRRGSGGAGRWPGGDGVIRQLRALEPLQVSLLTGSRRVPPFGLAGGAPGACGANWLLRQDGSEEDLPSCCELSLAAGEGLRIETPGGGAYGAPGIADDRRGGE